MGLDVVDNVFLTVGLGDSAAVFADRLLSALRFDARQLLGLLNRRNMILLCHAILLLILRDAGLLAAPARRRTSSATAHGGDDACSEPQPKSIVEARRSSRAAAAASSDAKSATLADDGRLKLERRRSPGRDKAAARLRRGKTSPVAREIIGPAVDKHSSERRFMDHSGVGMEIVAVEDKISYLHSQEPVADDGRNRGEMARQETEPECADDVDEMNKKFEDFIATMRRKMQLESLQLVTV
ncbi:uncharacterized protein LOC124695768 [Lolium rigidum]|uniref:uncharacterized protein LOC124695768 n=1 Tax=Lolium rigidum TaxID=89674 RepID=UPI001F5CFC50|nr:uncharacterized protein LOC124695768 [Lolium rigidum]